MTYQEYWRQVQDMAEEAKSMTQKGEFGTGETAREGLDQWLWESIDGHEFAIYTYKAKMMLTHTDNEGYSAENFGAEGLFKDGRIQWERIAFGALYGDVMDTLSRLDDFDINDPNPEDADNA